MGFPRFIPAFRVGKCNFQAFYSSSCFVCCFIFAFWIGMAVALFLLSEYICRGHHSKPATELTNIAITVLTFDIEYYILCMYINR